MPSRTPPEKRESCHAAASSPFVPKAIEPRFAPSRIGTPVSGQRVPSACDWAMVIGADHVAPWSCERITRSRAVVWLPTLSNSSKNRTSVPLGSTTT